MRVRFSKHAIQRLAQRFGGSMERLIEIVERGIFEKGMQPTRRFGWKVEGIIDGRPARVVLIEPTPGEFTIVTAMWCG